MTYATSLFLFGALLAHQVSAFPAASPQELDFDAISALPPAPTYTMSAAARSQSIEIDTASIMSSVYQAIATRSASDMTVDKVKRDACSPLPTGVASIAANQTVNDFMANEQIIDAAISALTPDGYEQVFQNMNGSTNAYYYLGYTLLDSYDTASCAAKCSSTKLCQSFNIYFERDPVVFPGPNCVNPASTTLIKCVFWGGPITANTATNVGQWQYDFQVVIAGSNGYVATDYWGTANVSGYETPTLLNNASINAPADCNGQSTYMGVQLFNSGPFDPNLCATACSALSTYHVLHGIPTASAPQTCQYFVTYEMMENGIPIAQYCAMYSQSWNETYATNFGQFDGQGNHYQFASSYMSGNATSPETCVANGTAVSGSWNATRRAVPAV